MTTQEKVSQIELQNMKVGETKTFYLNEKGKLQSAASTMNQLKNLGKGEWKHTKDYEEVSITITRMA
jgi:hypothetical protein